MSVNRESMSTKPEGTSNERAWRSVLLDFPYGHGSIALLSGSFLAFEAEKHRAGVMALNLECFSEYIARWVLAGFTPEMYWAVNRSLSSAVTHAQSRCTDEQDRDRLGERLAQLGIEAPNPKAGRRYLSVTGTDPATGRMITEERLHPLHIVQLVPEAWSGFPSKLQFQRPSVALGHFIYRADEG